MIDMDSKVVRCDHEHEYEGNVFDCAARLAVPLEERRLDAFRHAWAAGWKTTTSGRAYCPSHR